MVAYKKTRKVHGVGTNDAGYVTGGKNEVTGKWWVDPYYNKWKNMLVRCYSRKYQEKYPTYKRCSVCDEWLTFSNFKRWMEQQEWEGKQLDKDFIVPDNKVYSPYTCVFISQGLNKFTTARSNDRGGQHLGVIWHKATRGYTAQASDGCGKQRHLGCFTNQQEAHKAYQQAKLEVGHSLLQEQTDTRVVEALARILEKLQYELDNNLETLNLTGVISTTPLK